MLFDWFKGAEVIAIVPAYKETRYIGNAVRHLLQCKKQGLIQEIVVVDDGSPDTTAKRAEAAGADKVIKLRRNQGKARACAAGVRYVAKKYVSKERFKSEEKRRKKMHSTIVLFFDADLAEIRPAQVRLLLGPLKKNEKTAMVVGTVGTAGPSQSGQRAIRLSALGGMLRETKMWRTLLSIGYGLEGALNHVIRKPAVAETRFEVKRTVRREPGIVDILSAELFGADAYTIGRSERARILRMLRDAIGSGQLSKEGQRKVVRDILQISRAEERALAQKVLRNVRRVRKQIRGK